MMDGLTPKYLADPNLIIDKSYNIWSHIGFGDNDDQMKKLSLQEYGVRFYQ